MYNTGNKIVIWQLQNTKSASPKFYNVYARQKSKNKPGTFICTFSRNLCFDSSLRIVFKKLL